MNPSKEQLQKWISKSRRSRSLPSRYHLLERLADANELLRLIKDVKPHRDLTLAAKKNLVVNIVTALEVYFKEVIMEKTGRWSEKGFNDLLKTKVTLHEALEYAKIPNIRPEYIVSLNSSFKNPDSINAVFSNLLQKDFFTEIAKYEIVLYDGHKEGNRIRRTICLDKLEFDWKRVLYSLYDLRNKIVHDDSVNKFSNVDLSNYELLPIILSWVIQDYLNEHLKKGVRVSIRL